MSFSAVAVIGMINLPKADLKELILKAVASYNKYRSPEAVAKLVKLHNKSFIIEFSGSFCLSCGVGDYFEDFVYELKNLNRQIKVAIKQFKQINPESYEVEYVATRG
jgi:hypothetical protein